MDMDFEVPTSERMEPKKKSNRFSPEVRERAVRIVLELLAASKEWE